MNYLIKLRGFDELIAVNNLVDSEDFLGNIATANEILAAQNTIYNYNEILENPSKVNATAFIIDLRSANYSSKQQLFVILSTKFTSVIKKKD